MMSNLRLLRVFSYKFKKMSFEIARLADELKQILEFVDEFTDRMIENHLRVILPDENLCDLLIKYIKSKIIIDFEINDNYKNKETLRKELFTTLQNEIFQSDILRNTNDFLNIIRG